METTTQNTEIVSNEDRRPDKSSNRHRASDEKMMFWDRIRTQLKMSSDEDITDNGRSDSHGKLSIILSQTNATGVASFHQEPQQHESLPPIILKARVISLKSGLDGREAVLA